MEKLIVSSLGPISEANISFNDLTLFVGPQASGKSILSQLLKLLIDKQHIRRTLEQYGFVWGNTAKDVTERYFGEGLSDIWNADTSISFNGKAYTHDFLLPKRKENIKETEEKLFYIPAQRVMCFENGWPKFFTSFEGSVPFVLRDFSEALRQYLENELGRNDDDIFPKSQRLKEPLRKSFNDSVFHDARVLVDKGSKKQLKLKINDSNIPFMAWSAGQKEFMPLLLSFYWLCPASRTTTKDAIKYVIIEEPEMGLHPQAIKSIILQVLDLMSRGYKVIVSTHSPMFLEFAWAFNILKDVNANKKALYELFDLESSAPLNRLFQDQLSEKGINTYYFDRVKDKVLVKDISSLDAGSDDESVSEWGGLSSFSSKATDIVSRLVAANG